MRLKNHILAGKIHLMSHFGIFWKTSSIDLWNRSWNFSFSYFNWISVLAQSLYLLDNYLFLCFCTASPSIIFQGPKTSYKCRHNDLSKNYSNSRLPKLPKSSILCPILPTQRKKMMICTSISISRDINDVDTNKIDIFYKGSFRFNLFG